MMTFNVPINEVTLTISAPPHSTLSYHPDEERFYKMVQSCPKHNTVKLRENTFVQWKHQMKLIIDAYGLTEFVDGSLVAPPKFLPDPEGRLHPNAAYSSFTQQNKLLASWLLSTITGELLTSFTRTSTAQEVWSNASPLSAVASDVKLARLKHDLHSIKKENLLIVEYLVHVKRVYDLLSASGHSVSDSE